MKSMHIFMTALFAAGCSSPKLNVQKKSMKQIEDPIPFIKDHSDLKKPLMLNISINYPSLEGLTKDEAKDIREATFKSAVSQSLGIIYLLPTAGLAKNTSKVQILSEETGSYCKSVLVNRDSLSCASEKSKDAWNQESSEINLGQYHWNKKFGDQYLKECSNKPGVYLEYKETPPFELASSQLQKDSYNIDLKYTGEPGANHRFYKRFGLAPDKFKIITHKQDNAELSLEFFFTAKKKTGQLITPVANLSKNFDSYLFQNAIIPTKSQLQAAQNKILDLFQSFDFKKPYGDPEDLKAFYEGCPINQGDCGIHIGSFISDVGAENYVIPHMNDIDFTNKNQIRRLIQDKSYRTHIMGLLMLAHTTYEMERPSKENVILKFRIDLGSIFNNYPIKPVKEFME